MKKTYLKLMFILGAFVVFLGVFSLLDKDTAKDADRQELTAKPELTWAAVKDGSYMTQMEDYYADFFPFRAAFMDVNRAMNKFYFFTAGEKNVLSIEHTGGAEQGGAHLPGEEEIQTPPEEETPVEQKPEIDLPDESEITRTNVGTIIIDGDRAMEIPGTVEDSIIRYARTLSNTAAALGSGVRTFALVTPNSGQFYSPVSLHTGTHDQKAMIDLCYDNLTNGVVGVDAYTPLELHCDEYIYFRTDHHWTQLGAYYAYTGFCKAAGFAASPIESYASGRYDSFLGSLYNWTKSYPQSSALYNNPDILTYYLPKVETTAHYYMDATLTNGVPISVVNTNLGDGVGNKYLCYISGDTPICVIETAAEGGTCLVVKESYGNAFVPFLTEHYSKIITVDAREFNGSGEPSLNLINFCKEQGVNDLVFINYPFMVCNSSYVAMLEDML